MKIMKKKRILYALASVLIILTATLLIATEEHSSDGNTLDVSLYFFNETEDTIVAEQRSIVNNSRENLIKAVIEELKNGPANNRNKPIINESAEILSVNSDNKEITVDMSAEFISDNNSKTLLTTYAIVKSLCQIHNVQTVLVTCEGQRIKAADGNEIGFLSDRDIDLVTDVMTKDSKRITLYFADKNSECLSAENRTIKITDTIPIEQYVVSELIKGPQTANCRSVLSPDTQLISAQTTDGVCFVNFKSGFAEKNNGNERFTVYSVVNSLCELDNIKSVQFLIDGKKTDELGGINIQNPLVPDKNISK